MKNDSVKCKILLKKKKKLILTLNIKSFKKYKFLI